MAIEKLRVFGGHRLEGVTTVSGGKNTALAIIAAAAMSSEPCAIENLPDIEDIHVMRDILIALGAKVEMDGGVMRIDPSHLQGSSVPEHLACKLRASYYFLGALLARFGTSVVSYPGGCDIGNRPIDQHIKGFEALGATVETDHGRIRVQADRLRGSVIYLDMPSVGATINVMLAAALAEGNTEIVNAGKEPHIVDLANFLNSMGAKIRGAGTDVIRVRGVQDLHGTTYTVIPDQIETGTLMIAAAATRGDVVIHGCIPTHMEALTAKLLEMGVRVTENDDSIRVRPQGVQRAVNVKTQVYPGFPTDLQQPMTSLLCMANGVSTVSETIFERRFMHLDELRRMGAHIKLMDHSTILIEGVRELYGAPVTVTDLRAGAALIVAGLMAKGVTEIYETSYIDRGYERIEEKLRSLGADIRREKLS